MISTRRAWLLCVLLFFSAALCFLDRQVLSVLAPKITAEFGMSNTVYSRVVFAFVLSYTVMLALGGRVMDVLGTRRGLGLSVAFWSLASAAHAFVTGPFTLGVARFFLGVGEGPGIPGAIKGAVEWMDPRRRGIAVGLATSGAAVGSVLAPPLSVWAERHIGWRGAFAATAALGAVWLVAWLLAFRGLPHAATTPVAGARPTSSWRSLLARSEVRRLLAARFCFDPVFYFYMFWIPQYLAKERGMSLAAIGALIWIPFVALEVANIGAGFVSDRFTARGWPQRRARMTLMLVAALMTPASFLAALAGTPALAIGLMAVLMFAHGIWITNFMTLIGDTVEPGDVATTVGLTGMCGGIAGMLSNLVIGPVVDHYSFTPNFLASAVVYPVAWFILRGGRPSR
ncbi:MFS transporter [Horticoccus sp. 23ND18S-11]|uniref:MFS transporter n=1 Tax=Horticoccus sp. 23ND18S-11 TaxID=3391832 RepID=UPI0039C9BCD9